PQPPRNLTARHGTLALRNKIPFRHLVRTKKMCHLVRDLEGRHQPSEGEPEAQSEEQETAVGFFNHEGNRFEGVLRKPRKALILDSGFVNNLPWQVLPKAKTLTVRSP